MKPPRDTLYMSIRSFIVNAEERGDHPYSLRISSDNVSSQNIAQK